MLLEELPAHLYQQFARVGHALSDPTRLRIMNLLAQTERSVDVLAEMLGHSSANTSAHLKVLQQARLVDNRKEGRRVYYTIASEQALRLWLSLRDTGLQQIPEVREAMRALTDEDALLVNLSGEALLDKVESGEVLLLDLRPTEEYDSGHLPGARSIPFSELEAQMRNLPEGCDIVAYCRGPFCVAAIKGVAALRGAGLNARRLSRGVAEWRADGNKLQRTENAEVRP